MVHFSTSSGSYWTKQAQKLGGLALMAVTHFFGAIKLAKGLGLRVHVFEEGYLRPYWCNYERGGANGNSRLMEMTVAQMQKVLRKAGIDLTEAPAHWGDIRQHAFYSFVYHLNILLKNRAFPRF